MEPKDEEKVSYYLPRHEFLEKRLEMIQYIDNGDKRIEEIADQVNLNLHTFIESQKPLQNTMAELLKEQKESNQNVITVIRRTEKVEDEQERINESIKSIKDGISQKVIERNKLLLGFGGILLGAGGLVPVLAQIFFR
ncbi:hypothetical protein QI357_01665 [Staphylococcus saprophyticus]|nr:hypothetical protein [Staphylococcus saprophyticus]MDW4034554.1 hypothetical protein [Staphylococcus saprophyticus]